MLQDKTGSHVMTSLGEQEGEGTRLILMGGQEGEGTRLILMGSKRVRAHV